MRAVGALLLLFGLAISGHVEAADKLDRNAIFELQFRLDQLGYDAGVPDGRAGPRTLAAAAKYADYIGLPHDLSVELLSHATSDAANAEGWTRPDGETDLLVFTDEGSAQLVRVVGWGLIHKSKSEIYLRGYDRDGSKLLGEHFEVTDLEQISDISLKPWTTFGLKIIFPTPPRGERLEIDQSVTAPVVLDDGSVEMETNVSQNAFLKAPESTPWFWYRGIEEKADPRLAGDWTMSLGQNGHVLFSRTFTLRSEAADGNAPR